MDIRFAATMKFAGKIYLDAGIWFWQPYKGLIQRIRPNGMLYFTPIRRQSSGTEKDPGEEESEDYQEENYVQKAVQQGE